MNDNNHKVYAAINAVQNALKPGIAKDQKNVVQGYNFRGIDDIYNVVGPLLADHKLIIFPRMVSRECTEHKNAKGNTLFRVVVTAEYDFVSSEDGSCKVVQMYGEAMDSGDKATNKAMSAAYKYACIQTFSIPVTGEPDADSETHEVSGEEPRLPQPPKGSPRAPQRQETVSASPLQWKGYITDAHSYSPKDGKYTVYFVTIKDADGIHETGTYDESIYNSAKKFENVDQEVCLYYKPNPRKAGTFEVLDVEPIDDENPY